MNHELQTTNHEPFPCLLNIPIIRPDSLISERRQYGQVGMKGVVREKMGTMLFLGDIGIRLLRAIYQRELQSECKNSKMIAN